MFWKVTIKQRFRRDRHVFVVMAADETRAEHLVRNEYHAAAGQYDAEVEPVAPGEGIRGSVVQVLDKPGFLMRQ